MQPGRHNLVIRRVLLALVVVGVGLGIGLILVKPMLDDFRGPTARSWDRLRIGMTDQEVRALLGAPMREVNRAQARLDYRIDGYGKPTREIANRVLIYSGADMLLYVFIDSQDRVEELFRATS